MMIKQSVVDVLMFIFERFLGEDNEVAEERKDIHSHLEEMGFHHQEINKAFDWLEDLATLQDGNHYVPVQANSTRIFSDEEKAILNDECYGLILYLEQSGILQADTRELVLDRVIALNQPLDIEEFKWIVMIVLLKHPGRENAFAWMESLVFDEYVDYMQ